MLILLPPSEGKTAPRRGRPLDLATLSQPSLTDARTQVLTALVDLCTGDAERAAQVLDVPKTQTDLVGLDARVASSPTARADAVYAGVLYEALGLAALSTGAKRRAARRVMVTSSLFGLVGVGDRIPAYRLSGDAVLPGLGGVAAHWREHLGPAITATVGDGLLVDLRSTMYAAFWRPPPELSRRVATVRVLHEVDGRRQVGFLQGKTNSEELSAQPERRVVSHFNKATKGRIVRALLENGANPRTPAGLAEVLRDLGWYVELGDGARGAKQLDVVVREL